jgi:hypothetical protein
MISVLSTLFFLFSSLLVWLEILARMEKRVEQYFECLEMKVSSCVSTLSKMARTSKINVLYTRVYDDALMHNIMLVVYERIPYSLPGEQKGLM